jgi:hypothetical protein
VDRGDARDGSGVRRAAPSWTLLADASLRRITGSLLALALVLVSFVALLGVFVNKVAPVW